MPELKQHELSTLPAHVRRVDGLPATPFKFSICTLMTRTGEYAEMVESFERAGFSPADCEYLHIVNAGENQFDAYTGYNLFLQSARGEHVILCHQDILLKFDRRDVLEQRMRELDALDPAWALLGNAGISRRLGLPVAAIRISYPTGDGSTGNFPAQVDSLDENFIVVKREANLAVSHDLRGFHFYGTDLCQMAKILGRTAYAVDFHLLHKSQGRLDGGFFRERVEFVKKYNRALRGREVYATTGQLYLSGNALASRFFNLSRREILFMHLSVMRRHSAKPTPASVLQKIRELEEELGAGWNAFFILRDKIIKPFFKIRRWFGKKLFNRPVVAKQTS